MTWLAAYCILADLGAVYDRNLDGHTFTFSVSGYTYADRKVWGGMDAFLLWDRDTESLWWPPIGSRISIEHTVGKGISTLIDELASLATITKVMEPKAIFEIVTFRGRAVLDFSLNSPENCTVLWQPVAAAHLNWRRAPTRTIRPGMRRFSSGPHSDNHQGRKRWFCPRTRVRASRGRRHRPREFESINR